MKMRGQAFVVFDTAPAATVAMRELQGFPLYDKNMQIAYAKTKSNAVKNRDGSYSKRSRAAAIEMNGNESDASDDDTLHKRQRGDEYDSVTTGRHLKDNEEEMEEDDTNAILFVSQLPSSVTEESLSTLFAQNEGFKEVRIVPGRPDIAFVEYASSAQADQARMVLNGCQITPDQAMRVEFARR
ncbi:hypothetical protein, variant [Batrachochytrium dendrobatidis JEL423]|nr:hypothetical protein O5D80_003131 [Batrachochytrium dendrobatidis]OAJ40093.1 hypothetical protein, variant [Batrachochytrium dendrobatidis JEL423]